MVENLYLYAHLVLPLAVDHFYMVMVPDAQIEISRVLRSVQLCPLRSSRIVQCKVDLGLPLCQVSS